jgi:hypothetical protein
MLDAIVAAAKKYNSRKFQLTFAALVGYFAYCFMNSVTPELIGVTALLAQYGFFNWKEADGGTE